MASSSTRSISKLQRIEPWKQTTQKQVCQQVMGQTSFGNHALTVTLKIQYQNFLNENDLKEQRKYILHFGEVQANVLLLTNINNRCRMGKRILTGQPCFINDPQIHISEFQNYISELKGPKNTHYTLETFYSCHTPSTTDVVWINRS